MLRKQFFTRVQLINLLDFKSAGMIQKFEKAGFFKPDIKPSKYSINNAFFCFICKIIVEETNLSWVDLIVFEFNKIAECDKLFENDLLSYYIFNKYNLTRTEIFKDDFLSKSLDNVLNSVLNSDRHIYINIDKKQGDTMMISLKKLRQKFIAKCNDLNINLTEKLSA